MSYYDWNIADDFIKKHILNNQRETPNVRYLVVQVTEYFEDYDPLRSGSISKTQFQRGLGLLGLSKLGQHDLTQAQFKLLSDLYQNPKKEDQVLWTQFTHDVETGILHCSVKEG